MLAAWGNPVTFVLAAFVLLVVAAWGLRWSSPFAVLELAPCGGLGAFGFQSSRVCACGLELAAWGLAACGCVRLSHHESWLGLSVWGIVSYMHRLATNEVSSINNSE